MSESDVISPERVQIVDSNCWVGRCRIHMYVYGKFRTVIISIFLLYLSLLFTFSQHSLVVDILYLFPVIYLRRNPPASTVQTAELRQHPVEQHQVLVAVKVAHRLHELVDQVQAGQERSADRVLPVDGLELAEQLVHLGVH